MGDPDRKTTAGIALKAIGSHKPPHQDKIKNRCEILQILKGAGYPKQIWLCVCKGKEVGLGLFSCGERGKLRVMEVLCSLAKFGKHYHLVKNKIPVHCLLPTATVSAYNKDWQPGPYPRTKEECIAAAKKYNLIPEDYEPFPEDECMGDYPNLPVVSAEARNPFEAYDFPELRRNYGEPLHHDFDMYKEDMLNVEKKHKIPVNRQLIYLILGVSTYAGLCLLGEKYKYNYPIVPKQYPRPGVVHYTFEPDDETAVE